MSSKLRYNPENQTLYCAVRQEWVAAQPEEWIRQRVLQHLIDLQYPLSGLAVEKALRSLPHLSGQDLAHVPDRRADILVYLQGRPLLLIECKAVKLTDAFVRQVVGYNHIVQAPYIVLANEEEVRTGWFDGASRTYQFVPYIPEYETIKI